ncbi:LysM peptidoglycan-binding domain-containing protein [Ornithinibacillus halophilus]|uniref:LysM domain-containing protein n=1 Tax=Ornithinibacillus halophilus TaxID=930117 RepID=A0A1M5FV98_9BACI|nr:LysM peptidoglycan-binding domain-containing protein [Ornithinibacillus halophilus]SHF95403.1 LysM domain-containing protein [Ornithinibacillus halophilus]
MPIVDGKSFIYTVKPGDTLFNIASNIGGTVPLLVEANAVYPPIMDLYQIFPGQVLVVTTPGKKQVNHIVDIGEALYQIAERYSTTVEKILELNPQIENPNVIFYNQVLQIPAQIYSVEPGDAFFQIAERFGVSTSTLLMANQNRPGLSPDVVYPGYQIIIPNTK